MRKKIKKKNNTLGFNSKEKYVINQFYILDQREYCLEFSTFSFGVQGAPLLSSFTALVERRGTLERVPTGKQ